MEQTHSSNGQPTMLRLGGGLGIAACIIGLLIMVAACAGMSKAMAMSFIPLGLGGLGFVLAVVGANVEKHRIEEDTHVLLALFATCMGIIGGLVLMWAQHGWKLLP